jgi:hypothetical protein
MPTTSSYYADLEYPTVNEDASTYGTLINIYLDDLLTKLKAISTRVTNSQAQLGNINRGTNAVDRINNTLAGAIGSSALLPSTGTTLLPDPYSGTYTKTTSWPAFTSELASYSPPTTQSEVENFDYQGFATALQTEVDRIETTVSQAEADILAAQKDTCRAKKYVDVYQSGGTLQTYVAGDTGGYNDSHIIANFTQSSLSGTSSNRTVVLTFANGVANNAGAFQINSYSDFRSFCTAAGIPLGTNITVRNTATVSTAPGYTGGLSRFSHPSPSLVSTYNIGASSITVSGVVDASSSIGVGQSCSVFIARFYAATRTVYPTPDLTECETPNPPYFI